MTKTQIDADTKTQILADYDTPINADEFHPRKSAALSAIISVYVINVHQRSSYQRHQRLCN